MVIFLHEVYNMSADTPTHRDSIAASAETIRDAHSRAATAIATFEHHLAIYHVGVQAEVLVSREERDGYKNEIYLGYGRVKGELCIAVAKLEWIDGMKKPHRNAIKWRSASRELQMSTFEVFPDLVRRIAKLAATQAERAQKAFEFAEDIAKAISAVSAERK